MKGNNVYVYMVTVRAKKKVTFEKILFVGTCYVGEIKKVCMRFANDNGWSDMKILFYDRLGKLIQ